MMLWAGEEVRETGRQGRCRERLIVLSVRWFFLYRGIFAPVLRFVTGEVVVCVKVESALRFLDPHEGLASVFFLYCARFCMGWFS